MVIVTSQKIREKDNNHHIPHLPNLLLSPHFISLLRHSIREDPKETTEGEWKKRARWAVYKGIQETAPHSLSLVSLVIANVMSWTSEEGRKTRHEDAPWARLTFASPPLLWSGLTSLLHGPSGAHPSPREPGPLSPFTSLATRSPLTSFATAARRKE